MVSSQEKSITSAIRKPLSQSTFITSCDDAAGPLPTTLGTAASIRSNSSPVIGRPRIMSSTSSLSRGGTRSIHSCRWQYRTNAITAAITLLTVLGDRES